MFCVLASQGTVADFCSFCGRWPWKGLLRSSLSLLGLWCQTSTDELLWHSEDHPAAGQWTCWGCHSQVSLFLSTFPFQKPQFPHVDCGFGTRSEERRKKEEEGDCQALRYLVQWLPDWFLLIHLTWSHKWQCFSAEILQILPPHTSLFELCFQNECRNSHESNPNCFVSLFKWFCQWMAPWHQSSQWCIQIDAHPITDSSELLSFNHELFYFPDFTLPSFRNTYEQKHKSQMA